MLSPSRTWAPLGWLLLGAGTSSATEHYPHSEPEPPCTTSTCTVLATTILPVTKYVDVVVSVTSTVCETETSTKVEYFTESTTKTLYFTVSTTEIDSFTVSTTETDSFTVSTTETDSFTVSTTETDSATITQTETDLATITNTETDSTTITETSYTTTTLLETQYDPCPTTCKVSAATVHLFFWPTNRPYTYPTTYYNAQYDYTFTSPSVYMYIPTAKGTNSAGVPVGPSTTAWMLPLDLGEVSTIVDGSITKQLTLADLGTDCPQTADPAAIATLVDSACDPILAAPRQVSTWASPCNACGRFGLFDPPYAVPTITGLLETTTVGPTVTTTSAAEPVTPTPTLPPPESSPTTPPPPPPTATTTAGPVTAGAARLHGRLAWVLGGVCVAALMM